jgi:hypothetical protein
MLKKWFIVTKLPAFIITALPLSSKFSLPSFPSFPSLPSLPSFFLFLAMSITVSAQGLPTTFGDVTVGMEVITDPNFTPDGGTGYKEYRATIFNHSPTKTHQVTLISQNEDGFSGGGSRYFELRRTVEVAPAGSATISLLRPPILQDVSGFAVLIDGARQVELVYPNGGRAGAWSRHTVNRLFILCSQKISKSRLMNDPVTLNALSDPAGNLDVAYVSYDFPPSEWSVNWLGYSGFDGVIVTAEELRALPQGAQSALLRYLECGGVLNVLGPWEIPAHWASRGQMINGLLTYYVGFGVLTITGLNARIDYVQWKRIKENWEGSRPDPTQYRSLIDINRKFEVVDRVGIPVRGLFMLMIAFVIVIGPVNLLWLAKRKKRIWMLWTVPLLSLVTCLAVTAFAFLSEGISATSRTEALTILDETSHRATTIGWTAYYSPFTPGAGLHFSYDTELILQLPGNMLYRHRGGIGRGVDWTNDQHLTTEWLTARVPAYFKLRKSETRRERLTIRESGDGAPSIVNGLGADIRQLWWADSSGNLYTATNIPAGAQGSLTPINIQAAGPANSLRSLFSNGDWLEEFANLEKNPRMSLRANCYLAVIDASPFVEEGLRGVKTRKARTLVYGIRYAG